MKKIGHLAGAVAALAFCASAQAVTVYSFNYDDPFFLAPGVSRVADAAGGTIVATVGAFNATYGNIYRNSTTGRAQVTLSNLPAHSSIRVSFVMALLDSWDSTDGSPAPDLFNLYVDGALIGSYTANSASGSVNNFGGGTLLFSGVQFDTNLFYTDKVVDMGTDPALTFAHTASTLTLGWQAGGAGWQGGTDEAWALDNLVVSIPDVGTPPIPEPSTYALMLGGLAAVAAVARRRRQR